MNSDNETGYYSALGIERTSDRETIWKGFWRMSTKYHPLKHSEKICEYSIRYSRICEAYEVLSNPEIKEVYDNYGEDVLKHGLPGGTGAHCGYTFKGDCFNQFFTSLQSLMKEEPEPLNNKNTNDLIINLSWTLRELYNGCTKVISYKKDKLPHYSSRKIENLHFEKEIEIKPGYTDGQEIKYIEEGHDAVGLLSSDLVVKIKQIPHPDYKRVENKASLNSSSDHKANMSDVNSMLIYTRSITLEEALLAESFEIITLDDRTLPVSVDEIISQQTTTIIKGEGMPIIDPQSIDYLGALERRQRKGDLVIRYDIQYPKFLSNSQKEAIESIINE